MDKIKPDIKQKKKMVRWVLLFKMNTKSNSHVTKMSVVPALVIEKSNKRETSFILKMNDLQ